MTRPARNRLVGALFVVAAFVVAPRLPDLALWGVTAVVAPLLVLSFVVTRPYHRARSLLARKQYDAAATELAVFEKSLVDAPWKRAFASVAIGLYTANPVAAARNTLGAVRLEQGQLETAETHFKAALEQDAGYGVPWGNLAVLAAMRGDAQAAEAARQRAAALGFRAHALDQLLRDKLGPRKG